MSEGVFVFRLFAALGGFTKLCRVLYGDPDPSAIFGTETLAQVNYEPAQARTWDIASIGTWSGRMSFYEVVSACARAQAEHDRLME